MDDKKFLSTYNVLDPVSGVKNYNALIDGIDDYFNEIETCLNDFAKTFKMLFKGKDYDEYSYQAKALIETLNDIKIILNILDDISKNE